MAGAEEEAAVGAAELLVGDEEGAGMDVPAGLEEGDDASGAGAGGRFGFGGHTQLSRGMIQGAGGGMFVSPFARACSTRSSSRSM